MSFKIIDFDRKGNVVRFYLGKKTADWGWTKPECGKPSDTLYGYNWDVAPYRHGVSGVNSQFIYGHYDIYVPFDFIVAEPTDYSDKDGRPICISMHALANREMPVITIYDHHMCFDSLCEFYIGDELEKITSVGFQGSLCVPKEEEDGHESTK